MDSAHLHSLTGAFRGRRVVVIGDVVADEFVYGRVARVSREALVMLDTQWKAAMCASSNPGCVSGGGAAAACIEATCRPSNWKPGDSP